ncbi:MAG: hypothetical protein ACRD4I_17775 [Candidatus Angelobacter sp.]
MTLKAKKLSKREVWIFSILGLLLTLATGFYIRSLFRLGEEDYAMGKVRNLVSNEASFAIRRPFDGYSCSLADISDDKTITTGKTRNGYIFEINDCGGMIDRPHRKYHLIARPLASALPTFCCDETGVLSAEYTGPVSNCIKSGEPI